MLIRSEEHTSELQSLRHLVCRLLLEKKNTMIARWASANRSARAHPRCRPRTSIVFFFFNDTATTEIYTLSLHDALPISIPASIAGVTRSDLWTRQKL